MESDHSDYNGKSTEEISLHELFPPDSPYQIDLFGDRQANPRIGDEFQVNIPPMITGTEYIQLLMNPTDSNVTFDVSHSFLMGLPIPIVWLHDEVNNIGDAAGTDESFKCKKIKKGQINIGRRGPKLNASELCVRLKARKESNPENLEAKIAGMSDLDRLCKCTDHSPVPGLLGDSWSDAEKENFLLGLYIFGKSFFQIKRFIETKEMGDILSYYYGQFYRSNEHHRWSDCRKPRSRKCVYGRKIFTGWRQQELVSRMLRHVPDESHNSLLEASKSFAEGRTSLDIYVSYLKATVGLSALAESVGIGKGKEDLTSLSMEPVKINQVFPVCPKMPCGKACSSLTSSDIIKFLTGGFRLSKARCNDIFWEAVWPRLLARGWHSEQPKNQGYITSKDYLVFLMPGIKKFSRRKLVKGDHYFDSVSDILNKVASEPKLLELEAEESRVSSCNAEDQWVVEDLSDQDDPSNHQPHCYLKPRTSNCNSERMKFMVVDSSLINGGKSSKMRELRFLPVDFKDSSRMTGPSRESKGYFENTMDEYKLGTANVPLNVEKRNGFSEHNKDKFNTGSQNSMKFMVVDTSSVHGGKSSQMRALRYCPVESKTSSHMSCLSGVDEENSSDDSMNKSEPNAAEAPFNSEPDASISLLNGDKIADIYNYDGASSNEKALNSDTAKKMEICQDQKANKLEEKMSKRIIKHHFSRRAKSGNTNSSAPLIKRRRLTACAKTETAHIIENFSVGPGSKVETGCASNLPHANYNGVSQVGPSVEKLSSLSCSAEGSQGEVSSEGIYNRKSFGKEMSLVKNENHQIPLSIDLNLSQIPLESENGELVKMEVEDSQATNADGLFLHKNKHNLETQKTAVDVEPRRQSTRNRPLTAKALEALACGFLSINKKEKSKEICRREIPFSTPSRRARSRVKGSSQRNSSGTGIVDSKKEEAKEAFVVNKDITSKPADQIEEKSLISTGNS